MQQYYYLNGNQQVGPFTPEQLQQQPIGPGTLVWTQGLADWKPLADVPELSALFPVQSPVQAPSQPAPQYGQPPVYPTNPMGGVPPKTWLVESILVTIFCCLPLGIVGIINASKVETRFRMGDVQGAQLASDEAGRWTKIGFFASIGLILLYCVLIFLGVVAGISNSSF